MRWRSADQLIGAVRGRWDVPILANMAAGLSRPKDLLASVNAPVSEGGVGRELTPKVLTETLRRLEEAGLIRRQEISRWPRETHYWPTPFGYLLLGELDQLGAWYSAHEQFRRAVGGPHAAREQATPHVAQVYDYLLGGRNNLPSDRAAAEEILKVIPEARAAARENRAFALRAIRMLTQAGIRQFLDIGSGLPDAGHVHEISRRDNPGTPMVVVYADNDPGVVANGLALLHETPRTAMIEADLRHPEEITKNYVVRTLIDFGKPVGITLTGVLHFVADDDQPCEAVARLRTVLAPGSFLVVSHGCGDGVEPDRMRRAIEVCERSGHPVVSRSPYQVKRFLDGLDVLEPGVVYAPQWRPSPGVHIGDPRQSRFVVCVGRVR